MTIAQWNKRPIKGYVSNYQLAVLFAVWNSCFRKLGSHIRALFSKILARLQMLKILNKLRLIYIYSGIPIFRTSKGNELVRKIGDFEKSGVKLYCLTEEGKQLLVRVIERFETMRVREIGIPLYSIEGGSKQFPALSKT